MATFDRHPWRWLAAILVLFFGIRSGHLADVRYQLDADEGHYLRQAAAVADHGPGELRRLTSAYIDARDGRHPPPSRVGFLIPAGGFLRLLGDRTARSLTLFSTLCFAATVVVAFAFVLRQAPASLALLTAAFLASSPLAAGMSWRALSDSAVFLLTAGAISLFDLVLVSPGVLSCAGLAVVLAWLLSAKESAVLLVPVLLAAAGLRRRYEPGIRLRPALLSVGVALGLAGAVELVVCGGPRRVLALAGILLRSPAWNPYALGYNSGPWFRYLVDFMTVSPVALTLAIGFTFHRLATRERAAEAVGLTRYLMAIGVLTLAVYAPLLKNLRYVLAVELPIRFLAASGILALGRTYPRPRRGLVAAALAVAVLAQDQTLFRRLFVERQVYDPVTDTLLHALDMLPEVASAVGEAPEGDTAMKAGLEALYVRHAATEAVAYFRRVLLFKPDHYGANFQLAVALDQALDRDGARAQWTKVLALAEAYHDAETAERARARLAGK